MRGAAAAAMDGGFERYVDVVFRLMWEDGKKMDDPAVIQAALDQAGIDGATMLARIEDPAVKAKLVENTERSVERGCFGSPTFFVDGAMWFGKDSLRDVEEAILAAR